VGRLVTVGTAEGRARFRRARLTAPPVDWPCALAHGSLAADNEIEAALILISVGGQSRAENRRPNIACSNHAFERVFGCHLRPC
jgi:hypothetical protein